MIDSLNALSAKFDIANIKTDAEYKYMKKYIKENYCKNLLSTSQYFNFLDEENPQNVNNRKRYYFDIASKTAHRSNMFQKHGAIIVYKKNIISKGFNMYKGNSKNIYSQIKKEIRIQKHLLRMKPLVLRVAPALFFSYSILMQQLLKLPLPLQYL